MPFVVAFHTSGVNETSCLRRLPYGTAPRHDKDQISRVLHLYPLINTSQALTQPADLGCCSLNPLLKPSTSHKKKNNVFGQV